MAGTTLLICVVILVIAFLPNTRFTAKPDFTATRALHSANLKYLAITSAILLATAEWFSLLNRFTRSPVLMSTGHAVAHKPSTAQVSSTSYWYWLNNLL